MTQQQARDLELRGVTVAVGSKTICRDIDLTLPAGEQHVLFGPNGSGKSSLLAAIMGLPPFAVVAGEIRYGGERVDTLAADRRAALGIGLSFQRPPSITGVSVAGFADAIGARDRLAGAAKDLDLVGFEGRGLNSGFSGGESKRWEILKLFLQRPGLCLFDEPESGVDLEHIAAVGEAINRLVGRTGGDRRSALIITHTGFILDYIEAGTGHVFIDGRLVESGAAHDLFTRIQKNGYRIAAPA